VPDLRPAKGLFAEIRHLPDLFPEHGLLGQAAGSHQI